MPSAFILILSSFLPWAKGGLWRALQSKRGPKFQVICCVNNPLIDFCKRRVIEEQEVLRLHQQLITLALKWKRGLKVNFYSKLPSEEKNKSAESCLRKPFLWTTWMLFLAVMRPRWSHSFNEYILTSNCARESCTKRGLLLVLWKNVHVISSLN